MTVELLIVTHSDVLQQGLRALLDSIPEVTNVKAVKDAPSAYMWIEEHQPKIVLLDLVILGNGAAEKLEKIYSLSPETKRVLLADDVQDVRWLPQYAEAILIKGVSPSAVTTILTSLLSSQGDGK